jgi:O-antigen ligase
MSMSGKAIKVAMCLALLATTLPIFAGYTFAFVLLTLLLLTGTWRLLTLNLEDLPATLSPPYNSSVQNALAVLRPLSLGCLGLVFAHLLSALAGVILSPWAKPLGPSLATWSHTAVKYGLLWFTLTAGMLAASLYGWQLKQAGKLMFWWLFALFIYVIFQHWTGIDWVHGLSARLGPHRFAYGVYRVSGFMGHPLTFAYNLMLVCLVSLAMAWRQSDAGDKNRVWWIGCFFLSLGMLLISGSRFVLIVIGATILICEGRRLWQLRWRIVPILVGVLAILWLEGSALSRFTEVLTDNQSLEERFPRLVFWKLHWRMFVENPIAGVSRSGLQDAMQAYFVSIGKHDTVYEAHNLFLQYLADTGLVGFAGLAFWIVGLLIGWSRLAPKSSKGMSYLAVATLLSALMQNNLRDSAFVYALWFYLGALVVDVSMDKMNPLDAATHERKSPKNFIYRADSADSATGL